MYSVDHVRETKVAVADALDVGEGDTCEQVEDDEDEYEYEAPGRCANAGTSEPEQALHKFLPVDLARVVAARVDDARVGAARAGAEAGVAYIKPRRRNVHVLRSLPLHDVHA